MESGLDSFVMRGVYKGGKFIGRLYRNGVDVGLVFHRCVADIIEEYPSVYEVRVSFEFDEEAGREAQAAYANHYDMVKELYTEIVSAINESRW